MLLVLSDHTDGTVDMVLPKLERHGVQVLWWDPADYPARSRLTVAFTGTGYRQILHTGGRSYDLAEVSAVWNRRPNPPVAAEAVTDPGHRRHAERLAKLELAGFWDLLDAEWLPARGRLLDQAHNKLSHLAPAVEQGFLVPETVFTNDPDELVPAWNRAEGRLIAKLLQPEEVMVDGEQHLIYTTEIQRRHLTGRHRVSHEPVILQPYVDKAVELRVTVVGDQVFSAEIDSQSSRVTRLDWRHYEDQNVGYRVHDLPADLTRRCVRYVASLGLTFGAIDFILTPGGDYVFLEINPNGHWGWIEAATGLPISDAVADRLIAAERAHDRRRAERPWRPGPRPGPRPDPPSDPPAQGRPDEQGPGRRQGPAHRQGKVSIR